MGLGASRHTALVTGSAGFLGSHLCDRLLDENFEVIGLDNLMTGDLQNLSSALKDPHFHFQVGDVRNPLPIYAEFIFNLACPASPVYYQADPYATLTSSINGAQRIIELAHGKKCRIIHTSTSEVYGDPEVHPQVESYWGNVNPIGERACYDEGKRVAETLFTDAKRTTGLDARIVRIFNTYGPRMALDDGRVVSNFITQSLRGQPITIFGDGNQTRSFCYVSDLINGLLKVARIESLDGPINLGNPTEYTIRELAYTVSSITGGSVKQVFKPLPSDDPRRRKPDIGKAVALLGFDPSMSLTRGLRFTVEDFRNRLL